MYEPCYQCGKVIDVSDAAHIDTELNAVCCSKECTKRHLEAHQPEPADQTS